MSIDASHTDADSAVGRPINLDLSRSKSPSLSSRSCASPRNYDTGFSAPFCGSGNTTLRHPDANTSPDFFISSNSLDVERSYNRRTTFLSNRNKRTTLNHGKLAAHRVATPAYQDLSAIGESATPASPTRTGTSSGRSIDSNDSSNNFKDGPDSFSMPTDLSRPTTSSSTTNRGGNVFRKLRR